MGRSFFYFRIGRFSLYGKWDMSGMNKRLLKTLNYGTKREEWYIAKTEGGKNEERKRDCFFTWIGIVL